MFEFINRNQDRKARTWKWHLGQSVNGLDNLIIWNITGDYMGEWEKCPKCGRWNAVGMTPLFCKCSYTPLRGTYVCGLSECMHAEQCRHMGGDNTFQPVVRLVHNGIVSQCHSFYNRYRILGMRHVTKKAQ